MDDSTPGIGHNLSSEEQAVQDNILERHPHLWPRTRELLEKAAKVPDEIPEDVAPKWTDFVKSLTAQQKALEGARVAEKEEYLKKGRLVDGVFKTQSDKLKAAKVAIEAKLDVVKQRREAAEKAAAEEKARIAREAAEKARIEAEAKAKAEREEAERLRKEAEERQRQHEAEMARQRAAIEAAEKKRREERERLEAEQRAAEQRRREAEEAEAESKRKRDRILREAKEAEERAEKARVDAERAAEDERKRLEREARDAQRERDRQQAELERQARAAERSANRADRQLGEAEKKESAAIAREERVENASSSEFGRLRGEHGSLLTSQTKMTFANINVAELDLEKLRHHIPLDGYERAIRSLINARIFECRGVDIFPERLSKVV